MQIGERLADIRKDNKDTQKSLAAKLGVSVETIRSWERQTSRMPIDKLQEFCRMYGVTSDFILGLSNDDPLINYNARLSHAEEEDSFTVRELIELLKEKKKKKKK